MGPVVFVSTFWRERFNEELGPLYLVSALRAAGVEATVLYRHRGDAEAFFDQVAALRPAIVGFALSHKATGLEPIRLGAAYLRDRVPGVHITAGGVFVSFNWRRALESIRELDSVVVGEAEETIVALYNALARDTPIGAIPGVAWRLNGDVQFNGPRVPAASVDDYRWPARDYLETRAGAGFLKHASIVGSRGCKGTCAFCNVPVMYAPGPKLRCRDVRAIVDEMEHLHRNYRVTTFSFTDSSFEDCGKARLRDFADEIVARGLRIAFNVCFRAESFFETEEDSALIARLVQAGLYQVLVGLEASGNEKLRDFGKLASAEDNERFVRIFQRFPVHIAKGFMMFTPDSTAADLRCQLEFMKRLGFAHELIFMTTQSEVYEGTRQVLDLQSAGLLEREYNWEALFPYRFRDPRIGPLARAMRSLRDDPKLLEAMEFTQYFGRAAYIVARLVDCWEHAMVREYRSRVAELQWELARENATFFRKGIDLAVAGWDEAGFTELRDEFLEKGFDSCVRRMRAVEREFSESAPELFLGYAPGWGPQRGASRYSVSSV
jgi:radical SAM superfamily enzyme YgiQ (UPF0313 family)